MLYISRRVGGSKYAIVDTDDNTEEVISLRDLGQILDLGLEVKGVEVIETFRRNGQDRIRVKIDVYQNAAYATTRQAKLNVLKGVEIKTSGNIVTSISLRDKELAADTVIRLSDFGSECADCIFVRSGFRNTPTLTVILDDKIKLKSKSLDMACYAGIHFDLTEVTNPKVVQYAYHEWLSGHGSLTLAQYITDNKERYEYWEAVGVVTRASNPTKKMFSDELSAAVAARFMDEFERLASSNFQFASTKDARYAGKRHAQAVKKEKAFWFSDDVSYSEVMSKSGIIFHTISTTTTCNKAFISHFNAYIGYFTPVDEVKRLFMKLCIRYNRWIYNYGREMYWIV